MRTQKRSSPAGTGRDRQHSGKGRKPTSKPITRPSQAALRTARAAQAPIDMADEADKIVCALARKFTAWRRTGE